MGLDLHCIDVSPKGKERVQKVLDRGSQLIDIPDGVQIYFVGKKTGNLPKILDKWPKEAHQRILSLWEGNRIAFYYRFRSKRMVLVFYTRQNNYLRKDEDALSGLLLHEITHAIHDEQGISQEIKESFEKVFLGGLENIHHKRLSVEALQPILLRLGSVATLALKELFMVEYLIDKECGHLLLSNYLKVFPNDRCPRPIFYSDVEKNFTERFSTFRLAYEFVLTLLVIIVPYERSKSSLAKEFIKHIEKCYMVNLPELLREFQELDKLIRNEFSYGRLFQEKYFEAVLGVIRRSITHMD